MRPAAPSTAILMSLIVLSPPIRSFCHRPFTEDGKNCAVPL
jgi:hypothetical protein